jgi:CxxC-x17-CxxC domain-containing protein
MGNFNDRGGRGGGFRGGNRGGGRSNFGGNRGDGDRREVSMHKAICDKCHKSCEVPFKPSNDKPIYCNDCFGDKRENEVPRRDFKSRDSGRDFGNKQNFSKPSFEKSSGDEIKKQLAEINSKLGQLIFVIEKMAFSQEIVGTSVQKKVAEKKPVEVAKKIADKKPAVTTKKVVDKKPAKKVVVEKKVTPKKVVVKKKK